jgi:pimeloyl-ACP methyl ester carboxylesterase
LELAYETYGDPAKPAILLQHGFLSCNGQWLLNRETLGAKYYLVMVELWGHGNSPTPTDITHYTVDTYCRQFEAIRAALNIPRWHLIGQSYGVGIVLNYAIRFPQVCSSLVATNSKSAFGQQSASQSKRRYPQNHENFDARKLPYHPIHARRFPAHVKHAMVTSADTMSAEAIILGGKLGANLNCNDRVGELTVPLLIANGQYEKSFQTDLAVLQQRYPHLRVENLAGGHSVNIEAADAFNQVVLEFLTSNRDK